MNRSRVTGDLASHGNIFVDIANDRVGIGSTIPGEKLSLPDSAKIALGNSADLQLFHDGTHSFIQDNGTGDLIIYGTGEDLAKFKDDGAVELYYNGSKKIETTNTGAIITGILTATSFVGGLPITDGADNRVITAASASTIQGEQYLTYDGNALSQTIDSNDEGINITASGAHAIRLKYDSNQSSANDTIVFQSARWNGTEVASMHFRAGADTTNKDDGLITFHTTPSGGSNTERLRITPGGDLGVGNDSPSCRLAVKDVAEHTAYNSVTPNVTDVMLQLYNNPPNETANDHATIQFGVNGGSHNRVNSISAVAESAGNRKLAFTFCTDEAGSRTEKLRITGDGDMALGTTTPNTYSNQTVFTINGTTYGRLDLEVAGALRGSVWANTGGLGLDAGGYNMEFYTGSAQSLELTNTGSLRHTAASGLSYFTGSSEYIFGSTTSSPPAGGSEANVQIHGSKTRAHFSISAYMNNAGGPFMNFVSSRSGTVGTLGTKVNNGDSIGDIRFAGDNGTNYNSVAFGAQIYANAASTPGDGDTVIAGRLKFATGTANAGSIPAVMELREDGQLNLKRGRVNNNGSLLYCWGGFIAGTATLSFDIPVFTSGNIYRIDAFYSHHSLSYGCYKYGIYGAYSGHSGLQINNDISSHSSTLGGSFTITRGSAGQPVVVAKTAGTYTGQGYYFVNVYAGNYTQL